jgi:hypothetical protein
MISRTTTIQIAKFPGVNASVLPQTQCASGLIEIPRRWLRVKRMFAGANMVDDFSEIIVWARA